MRASRIPGVAAVAVTLACTACVTAEAHNSDYGSSTSYQVNVPGGIPSLRSNVVASQASSSSSWEWGAGAHIAPGFETGSPGVTLHPMASYSYLKFDGGHDDRFEFGGQIRKALGQTASSRGFWIGAQPAFAILRTHVDNVPTESTNGWSLTALAGVPVSDAKWGASFFGGAGVSHYGSTGVNLRAGLDLQPWFMKSDHK